MKKTKLLRAMSLADEKYVAEADPTQGYSQKDAKSKKPKSLRFRLGVLAACLCIFTLLNVVFFIPYKLFPPSVYHYSDSPYYEVIKELRDITYSPRDENLCDQLFPRFYAILKKWFTPNVAMELISSSQATPGEKYREITDNQEQGIVEADKIKQYGDQVLHLSQNTLSRYRLKDGEISFLESYGIDGTKEFFWSDDGTHISLLSESDKSYVKNDRELTFACTEVISLKKGDDGDASHYDKNHSVVISGRYRSSRKVGGDIIVVTSYTVSSNPDFSNESDFLPQIDTGDGMKPISPEMIHIPQNCRKAYMVVVVLDEETLEVKKTTALLTYSENFYFSNGHIYFVNQYKTDDFYESEIICVNYKGENMEVVGSVTLGGRVKNQYSLDEHNGVLRVVITSLNEKAKMTSASLYCIDITSMKPIAQLENFAPAGEYVASVRYDDQYAYVCTSTRTMDPVFYIDLSDLNNITYKATGTLPGFSTSLVDFNNGYLVGIGRGENNSFKVEIYREVGNSVESVCKYELPRCAYSSDYKSYYIDRENQLIGIPIKLSNVRYEDGYEGEYEGEYEKDPFQYLLLHFDGEQLTRKGLSFLSGDFTCGRGVYIDGYFYVFGQPGEAESYAVTLN